MVYKIRERFNEDLLQDLLLARGYESGEAQDIFLQPDFARDSHDPFSLPDMSVAVGRIVSAFENSERICVWSDYDCDGVPGGVLLSYALRQLVGERNSVEHYIPHRHHEGYGLNEQGIKKLSDAGITLIITVDLGTTNVREVAYAKSFGIDVIVTDHHEPPPVLPDALAIVNPKRTESTYPFDGLCGAGVAWKLVQALLHHVRLNKDILTHEPKFLSEGQEKWLLDLVGIATLSDMVPLVGENRMLAYFGLRVLRRGRRKGLAELLRMSRIQVSSLTEDDVGFMISPRINAASRMDTPLLAAELLASEEGIEALSLAKKLESLNDKRKTLVATTVKEVNKRLAQQVSDVERASVIVMGSPNWRPGVLGLVANKVALTHGKPTFLWGREGGELMRGSCRAGGDVSVVELMRAASDAFEHFGGHHASGGFAVSPEQVHMLGEKLCRAHATIQETFLVEEKIIFIERELSLHELEHVRTVLARLAPFGVGNPKPLFIFLRVRISRVRLFGKAKEHLELMLTDTTGAQVSGIAFFSTPESFTKVVDTESIVDVVGYVESDWKGGPRIRIEELL